MDDSCAVCADSLEWVAYGPCGHREVCSTCTVRLRFVCLDRRCCICKAESDRVFVTKALGDYTKIISDFGIFPAELREGRVGSYWYHEDTQAIFDDEDHYKMIKAKCKLSCSICDKMDEQQSKGEAAPKKHRRSGFQNIKQLKDHLFHKHRSFMCSLCLKGKEDFISEQKVYTRAQLNQHIRSGDSEVDGTETERGGFSGHPFCQFCRIPFYSDNELYRHMSEHYTCHICTRQHPGHIEYFQNYDDLEMHFRGNHFLCEDEACLAKKFVVFTSEAEMKRHNTVEHGGRMSRSKRNAVLQIPTSFRYSRSSEQDHNRGRGRGRGRGRTFRPDFSEEQLSRAIEASFDTAISDNVHYDPSTGQQISSDTEDPSELESLVQPFDSLSTTDGESSSRYLQALGHNSRSRPFEESLFPPLSSGSGSSQPRPAQDPESSSNNTMAAHLRRQSQRNVSTQAWPGARPQSNNPSQAWPSMSAVSGVSWGSGLSKPSSSTSNSPGQLTYASFGRGAQPRPTIVHGQQSSGLSRGRGTARGIPHSSSAPNLVESGSSFSDFPPVSVAVQTRPLPPPSKQALQEPADVHSANKALIEKIRAALDFDEEKFDAFKEISGRYRQGTVGTEQYLNYVQHHDLSHLLLDLARLCPDSKKQKELIETYNARVRSSADEGSSAGGSKKGKGKALAARDDRSKETLADNFLSTVRKLQSNNNNSKPSDEDVEVLSKDGYRGARGTSKLTIDEPKAELNGQNKQLGSGGSSKQRKKTSKFTRVRLGDAPATTHVDSESDGDGESTGGGLPVRGVWRSGGGQRLFP